MSKPKVFTCVRCGSREEVLPTGMTDIDGETHYVYTTPPGWWSITNRYEMLLFCADEAVTIVSGQVLESDHWAETGSGLA